MTQLTAFEELSLKQNVISNIQMLQDYLPQHSYTFEELIGCTLENLEGIRESMIPEYNEVVRDK